MHKEFLQSLSRDERQFLTEKTDSNGLFRLFVLITLVITVSFFIIQKPLFWPLLLLPQALLLVSLFHLLHECIHDTPFKTRWLNTCVGWTCGFVLFLPSNWFKYFHRAHHRYTQIPGKDPELEGNKPDSIAKWLIYITGIPVYKSMAGVFYRYLFGKYTDPYIPQNKHTDIAREVRGMVAGYTLLSFIGFFWLNTTLLWVWIIPLCIGQPFLRIYLLAEHTLCENSENMFANTRTVLSNPLVRWFSWNMPLHTEHHVYPAVPFHKLPTLHKYMQQHLLHREIGYVEFNRKFYSNIQRN